MHVVRTYRRMVVVTSDVALINENLNRCYLTFMVKHTPRKHLFIAIPVLFAFYMQHTEQVVDDEFDWFFAVVRRSS